ncbi:MAG: DoxX family protein [Marinoscillum sp.]
MNTAYLKFIKTFLRLSIASAFLSAVFDRFGIWPQNVSAWGNWDSFLDYTATLIPWVPDHFIPFFGFVATAAEVVFSICLLIGYKTSFFAKLSGLLLLCFGLAMSTTYGLKAPLDYSVFTGAAAAFALGAISIRFFEVDSLFGHQQRAGKEF